MSECGKPATVLLLEVYGSRGELVPWLVFCDEHWMPAKRFRNGQGQRMGVQLLRGADAKGAECGFDPDHHSASSAP